MTIHNPNDSSNTRHTLRTIALAVCVLGSLMISACDASEPTTIPPTPTTTLAATTQAPPRSTTSTTTDGRTLAVPAHQPPTIDGVLTADEWAGSVTVTMTDDSVLHWMHDENTLYMALESGAVGAVNLLISTADETLILHSSAALGSALYVFVSGVWELSHGFDWCCRSATNDSDRLLLLDEQGWQANIGFAGDEGIVEYEVTLPWDGAFVAVSYLTDTKTSAFWPADLSSEARDHLIGPPPPERNFNLDEWYTLVSIED